MRWFNEAIFYHIYPLGFCGAPKINNEGKTVNRIEKVIDWIPHLKKMSVNALYIGPVFESSQHGYDTKDYMKVDMRLGTNENFKKVCDELHKNNIRVILDGVFNHVGREFWAFKDVQKNLQNSKYCSWFQNLNFGGPSPMGDPFWYEAWNGHYNLVKLNIHNDEVKKHIFSAIKYWVDEFNIDGLRLDAADYMDRNFFKPLRTFCKGLKEDFYLMGEVIHGDYNMWANKDMLDAVTNYECYKGIYSSHNTRNYFEIGYSLNRQFGDYAIYKNIPLYNFVDNHDVNRMGSTLDHKEHLKNIYTILFTMPGVPSIYYGSEWGIEGVHKNNSDDELRPCLDLSNISGEYKGLEEHIEKLGLIRSSLKQLSYGQYRPVVTRNEQLVYKRECDGKAVYTALNLDKNDFTVEFNISNNKKLIDRLNGGKEILSQGNRVKITIPAYGSCILEEADKNN